MRDDDSCAPVGEIPEAIEPVSFGPRIDSASGLIKNDELSLSQESSRQGEPLPFAAAQFSTLGKPFAQKGIVATRKP
jgi:hypothetical protein